MRCQERYEFGVRKGLDGAMATTVLAADRYLLPIPDGVRMRDAALVVIMDRKNWDQVQALAPETEPKVVWIGCALPEGSVEVADPYGRSEPES